VPRRLSPEGLEVGPGVGTVEVVEVGVVLVVGAVFEADLLVAGAHTEPPAFDLDHVADQSEQRQAGRRHRACLQLVISEAGTLHQERLAMEVQPLLERLTFAGDGGSPSAFDDRCGPGALHAVGG
jgi:hypothetical protein